jgi:hypothetical protein
MFRPQQVIIIIIIIIIIIKPLLYVSPLVLQPDDGLLRPKHVVALNTVM